jgi:uncharacterized membrane protein
MTEIVQVLVILFGSLVFFRVLGFAGIDRFTTWTVCARTSLATMFLFSAMSHFTPMKKDLIAMVPPTLPRPELLVFITGLAELAGAVGLLIPPLRFWAACGLILLLLLMLPANVSAASRGIPLRGRSPTPLWLRVPMQVLFIVWAWMVR